MAKAHAKLLMGKKWSAVWPVPELLPSSLLAGSRQTPGLAHRELEFHLVFK